MRRIRKLIEPTEDISCKRFGSLAIANLAVCSSNHGPIFESGAIELLLRLAKSVDIETKRCVAFALHNIALCEGNHRSCEKLGVHQYLVTLLNSRDHDTNLQACLAVKYFCVSPRSRAQFVEYQGLPPILKLAKRESVELRREMAASLRNISISDQNKESIIREGGLEILSELCRSPDDEISHQTCGIIANLAEAAANQ
eukprot:10013638-Ditylum_brightwellii.AAC.1